MNGVGSRRAGFNAIKMQRDELTEGYLKYIGSHLAV